MKILEKGEKSDVTKGTGLTKVTVGLGWDATKSPKTFDADASAFVLDIDQKVISTGHFVYYGNLKSPESFIVHSGDNLTGVGAGDDEQIVVDFSKAPAEAQEVIIIVNLYKAEEKGQNFGMVSNAFIRVCDPAGAEQMRFDLSEEASAATAMIFGKFYKHNGEWKFQAIAEGEKKGLQYYSNLYAK